MKVVIIDYGAGNIKSLQFALQRLDCNSTLSASWEEIKKADKVIFPGVGQAASALQKLKQHKLHLKIPLLKQPVMGICLGMQLMCSHTEEGDTKGLNIFNSKAKRFSNKLKVPQIGWNQIYKLQSDLFNNIAENEYMYLVHSYYVPLCENTIATTNYGISYSTGLRKDNFYGLQFHPEKSSKAGSRILNNFLKL